MYALLENIETPIWYIAKFVVPRNFVKESDISLSNNVITIQENSNKKKSSFRTTKFFNQIYGTSNALHTLFIEIQQKLSN